MVALVSVNLCMFSGVGKYMTSGGLNKAKQHNATCPSKPLKNWLPKV